MRLDLFTQGDSVLLLGEGNFSFSVCLLKSNLPISMVATCFEDKISYEGQQKNIEYLKLKYVPVMFNVDATKLHENKNFRGIKFTKIVFNFPHVGGKMKIQLNRDLLKNFFKSVGSVLDKVKGSVIVSLCQGQGGTPLDEPQRKWNDSWQITEMAAHGGFILTRVEPFCQESFLDYSCIGYRSQDVRFSLDGALVYVFMWKELPFENLTENYVIKNMNYIPLCLNCSVKAPVVYSEFYANNPLLNSKSSASFITNLLLDDLNKYKSPGQLIKTYTDDDIPLFVSKNEGISCTVHSKQYKLRETVFDVLNTALNFYDENTKQIIVHPGMYFPVIFNENFMKEPMVSLKFVIIGEVHSQLLGLYLQHIMDRFRKYDCVISEKCTLINGSFCESDKYLIKQAKEFIYENTTSKTVCSFAVVYSINYKGKVIEVNIINVDKICKEIFKLHSWKEIWSEAEVVFASNEKPCLKPGLLFPSCYTFDITLRYNRNDGFSVEKMNEILWLGAGDLIENVEFVNYYDSKENWSSKCYRLTYRSWNKPLYREHVINIHQKLIGPLLERQMKVTIG